MKKYIFIDRDGTLVYEPHDYQVDALDKIRLLPEVIPALLKLQQAGYSLVMVSNQDGLGTSSFPLPTFTQSHEFILNLLESQGIYFEQVLICPHKPEDNCDCRKPKLGMVQAYLSDPNWDKEASFFLGDRDTDMTMAQNMGIKGFKIYDPRYRFADSPEFEKKEGETTYTWSQIAAMFAPTVQATVQKEVRVLNRVATYERNTNETKILVRVDLDHSGNNQISTGIGFFDHMLDQIATHANFSMFVKVEGDLEVDGHHTIEDTAIALGTALRQALGDKRGIGRFGFVLPMDEVMSKVFATEDPNALCYLNDQAQANKLHSDQDVDQTISVALDISGRPHSEIDFDAQFTREDINGFETQMVSHFFESLAVAMGLTLHMSVTQGNAHHQVEALFKAFGRALRPALKIMGNELPSSKGTL